MKTKILADFKICISAPSKNLQRNDKLRMQGSDKGCGFAISTDDMPKKNR